MGYRIHSVPTYKVKYGNTISSELTLSVVEVFRTANSGWVSDTEEDGEINREELLRIIAKTPNGKLKDALTMLEQESDKDNDFVRFSLF